MSLLLVLNLAIGVRFSYPVQKPARPIFAIRGTQKAHLIRPFRPDFLICTNFI